MDVLTLSNLLSVIGLGITVFTATNIDDIFILIMFFADRSLGIVPIIIGQAVGILLLVGISLVGALVALVVPPQVIGLMGLLPIAIGIKKLIDLRQPDEPEEIQSLQNRSSLRFLAVAGVTFANGGDNIGVYIPVFATSTPLEIVVLVIVFMLMVAVWCAAGYFLVNHSFLGSYIRRAGRVLLPFVLMALGVFILIEGFDIGLP